MRSGDPLARDADAGVSAGRSRRRMPGTITMRARRTWWCLVGLLGCSKGSEPTTTTTTAGHEGPEAQASSGDDTGDRGSTGAGTSAKTSSGGASPEDGTSGDEAPGDEAPGDTTRGGEVTGGGTSGGTSQGDEASEVGEPGVAFVGRHDARDPSRVRYAWSGAGFRVRFRGTGVHATLDDAAVYHTVVVDGVVTETLQTSAGERRYTLAADLPAGEHVVELLRRTEASLGETVVLGVEVDGELLAPSVPTRRIEVVGDSITCGYGNEGPDESCPFSAETENHYLTYAAIAARAVGAELSTVAWSGKGVVYNYGDDKTDPLPALYGRTLPSDPSSTWDGGAPADVVVVNLGTNDFSTDDDPPQEVFVQGYLGLLANIRTYHPGAEIVATVAPLLEPADFQIAQQAIEAAIAEHVASGDVRVRWIDLNTPAVGRGCDWHPSRATHENMAALLVPELERALSR